MSIKSDKWIKRMCTPPKFMVQRTNDGLWLYSSLEEAYLRKMIEKRVLDNYRVCDGDWLAAWKPMIEPFSPTQVRELDGKKIVSWGNSSYGYDVRCADEFKVFTNLHSTIVDPKNFSNDSFVDKKGPYCIIPPNSFALARTTEYFRVPRNVLVVCLGKSTYARCGIIVNVTPLEPEWEGYLTLEFSNTTPLPAKIYANEGCAQLLFFESDEECETSYKDRGGKYQGQAPVPVPPKV